MNNSTPVGRIEKISDVIDLNTLLDGSITSSQDHELHELRREYADLSANHAELHDSHAALTVANNVAHDLLKQVAETCEPAIANVLLNIANLLNNPSDQT